MVSGNQPFRGRGEAKINITRVGVDIAKSVFHVHAVDRHGSLLWQGRLKRNMQAAHRIREELVGQGTAKSNQIRRLVGEYGSVTPAGIGPSRQAMPQWLEDSANGLTDDFRALIDYLADGLRHLDGRIADLDERIETSVLKDPVARRLLELRGVGPLTASALAGALGDGKAFSKGRDFAASLGLTPRQHSTGGKDRLLGTSKRGDSYLRKLLVQGARSVIRHAKDKDDGVDLHSKLTH